LEGEDEGETYPTFNSWVSGGPREARNFLKDGGVEGGVGNASRIEDISVSLPHDSTVVGNSEEIDGVMDAHVKYEDDEE